MTGPFSALGHLTVPPTMCTLHCYCPRDLCEGVGQALARGCAPPALGSNPLCGPGSPMAGGRGPELSCRPVASWSAHPAKRSCWRALVVSVHSGSLPRGILRTGVPGREQEASGVGKSWAVSGKALCARSRDRLEQLERKRERERKMREQQKEQREQKERERRAEERRKEREARREGAGVAGQPRSRDSPAWHHRLCLASPRASQPPGGGLLASVQSCGSCVRGCG